MKKAIIFFAFAGMMLSACNGSSDTSSHKHKGKYICTMHPEVSTDKPGVCPKCGMELVERDTTGDR